MENICETQAVICREDTEKNGALRLSALLHLAQEAAGEHCKALGLDWEALAEKKLFWAVLRTRVELTRLPRLGDRLTLRTWPMPTSRSAYPRCVLFLDEQGNTLATVTSLWVLMHREKRAMVLPGKSGVTVEGILTGQEPALPGSLSPTDAAASFPVTVTRELLDRNGHMNNARYLDWLQPLTRGRPVVSFTVNYLAEALLDQALTLQYREEADCLRVDIHRQEGEKTARIFAAQLHF